LDKYFAYSGVASTCRDFADGEDITVAGTGRMPLNLFEKYYEQTVYRPK
jgi:hypothetical protein